MDNTERFTIDLNRPLLKDGPNFLSHTVVIKRHVAYLRPTVTSMSFCMVYIVVGSFLMALAAHLIMQAHKYDLIIFVGGFGVAITTFGVLLIRPFIQRASFNKNSGVFDNKKDRDVKLHHIDSLQINNKIIQRRNALSYQCFELNMLTQHGRRINVLNHNDQQQLMLDALLLSTFLKVEIQDFRREIII